MNQMERIAPHRILLLGARAERLELYVLKESGWHLIGGKPEVKITASNRSRIVGLEISDSQELERKLDAQFTVLLKGGFDSCYVALPDRKSLRIAEPVLGKNAPGRLMIYGVDPDYYYSLVPLTGRGHRAVERFVLGLKAAVGPRAAIARTIKSLLIGAGLSKRLYEGFVIVVEGS